MPGRVFGYDNFADSKRAAVCASGTEPFPDAPGPATGTRYFPTFDAENAKRLYALHIYTAMRLIEQLSLDFSERHPGAFGEQETHAIEPAIDLMVEEGMLLKD